MRLTSEKENYSAVDRLDPPFLYHVLNIAIII